MSTILTATDLTVRYGERAVLFAAPPPESRMVLAVGDRKLLGL